jgi:hypothetical protein
VDSGHQTRLEAWAGVRAGDAVEVAGVAGRRAWVFVAHVTNEATGEAWVEVRGGRRGEAKFRAFAPEAIYPAGARRGSRWVRASLARAPRLDLR